MKAIMNLFVLAAFFTVFSFSVASAQESKDVKNTDANTTDVKSTTTQSTDVKTDEVVNPDQKDINTGIDTETNKTKDRTGNIQRKNDVSKLAQWKQDMIKKDPEKFRELKKERMNQNGNASGKHGLTKEEQKKEREKRQLEKQNHKAPKKKDKNNQKDQ